MTTWIELNNAVKAALRNGALEEADKLLAPLHAEARRRDETELLCNSHFTEGLVRDAQGRLAEAEDAFTMALRLDEKMRGADHVAVAETLHSIGIVRTRRNDYEGALAAYQRAASIFRVKQPFQTTRTLCTVGSTLLKMERFDEAVAVFEEAFEAAKAEPKTPYAHGARALFCAGEALRQSRNFPKAAARLAMATQMSGPKMSPELADIVTRAWYTLGIVSRYGLQNCQTQAAVAFWYASQNGAAPEVSRRAEEELAKMPERSRCQGDPARFRLVFRDANDNLHVASSAHGMYHLRQPFEAELGAAVDVELEDGRASSVTVAAPT